MNITPTLVVLLQELERFNKLVNLMSQTLSLLRKALAGEIGMGSVLDEVAGALYNGQIPNYWRKLAPDTTKSLAYWIEHLNQRANQYRYWASSGEPLVMWLSGLHMPQSFLTALVQIACRKNNWPLDRSTLFTEVTRFADPDDVEERPESVSELCGHPNAKKTELSLSVAFAILSWFHFFLFSFNSVAAKGCYVHGLFLEGARWCLENQCLEKSLPKVLVEPLPILSINPTEVHRLKLQVSRKTFSRQASSFHGSFVLLPVFLFRG